ncbi:radical SAM (seleno)protein TrsS [Desulfospira joergensenii]|uniref:radical SAM (seleno)protein TrsS n=1 Tax=Desulfospira joergensenii TaxID=53329 RepID=UPI001FC9920B|nr:radical SAM (seleno)protein TrsS [Desulfospira joergensenii]
MNPNLSDPSLLSTTQSLCPVCMEPVPAARVLESDMVFLEKTCPVHGNFRVKIWKGRDSFQTWTRPKIPIPDRFSMTGTARGCPFDCGLCPEHRQHTCTAVLEITARCNLKCQFCFAGSGPGQGDPDPSLEEISQMLDSVWKVSPKANLQISGGEPSLRRDLPRIVESARETGFGFIQLNTNGILISRERSMAKTLKSAGLSSVFLQFDGVSDRVYRDLRGQDLFKAKQEAVSNCIEAGLGVVLVPTLVPGVNISQVGPILEFALDRLPGIRGVHFQPVAWFGRCPVLPGKGGPSFDTGPGDNDRITIPEILEEIEVQTQGRFRREDFRPPGCEHSLCSFNGKFLIKERGIPEPLTGPDIGCCTPIPAEKGAARAKASTALHWKAPGPDPAPGKIWDGLDQFLNRARTRLFSVSGMAFQDIWNLDLERLKGCCIHSVAPDGRLIPFCAYNLTSAAGKGVHRK